ncbi:hypothetical protein LIER_30491 [Lithospermum erythrorhizon]|uniref:Reverse transcriptase Ty1/copia-type domain-containing protein n=1 Tax=Lithospermum erythrorhizon TaxID=34254 RepID=A0AAV3RQY2_LITER
MEEPTLRRSSRDHHEPERWYGEAFIIESDEPASYKEEINSKDADKWQIAMQFEMDSMYQNKVWSLLDLPNGVRPIECKWVFKKKHDKDGNVDVFKARLVAKGFKQVHDVDYDETYSPVAMLKSIRIILAIAAFHDHEIWQMDERHVAESLEFANPKEKKFFVSDACGAVGRLGGQFAKVMGVMISVGVLHNILCQGENDFRLNLEGSLSNEREQHINELKKLNALLVGKVISPQRSTLFEACEGSILKRIWLFGGSAMLPLSQNIGSFILRVPLFQFAEDLECGFISDVESQV